MRIAFLCGSLEPGRDGVGDYTRMLAGQLIKVGHSVSAIALVDPYFPDRCQDAQVLDEQGLTVYRIPSSWSSSRRFHQAQKWLDEIQPDWLSLQFVIYSFHPKGLPFGLSGRLAQLTRGRSLHVMLHEIWVGFTRISPVRHKVLGLLQRRIIKNLLKSTKANLVTTTNGLYQAVLARHKIPSNILPLFSNIALAAPDDAFVVEVLTRLGIAVEDRDQWKIMGFFGSLYPDAALEKVLEEELEESSKNKLVFIGFGRIDDSGAEEFKCLRDKFFGRINFCHFGELPAGRISQLLQILDLGISCTPQQHLGKSGVFAAMKHHDLEVRTPNASLLPEYDQDIKNYHTEMILRPADEWGVAPISQRFLDLLN